MHGAHGMCQYSRQQTGLLAFFNHVEGIWVIKNNKGGTLEMSFTFLKMCGFFSFQVWSFERREILVTLQKVIHLHQ